MLEMEKCNGAIKSPPHLCPSTCLAKQVSIYGKPAVFFKIYF